MDSDIQQQLNQLAEDEKKENSATSEDEFLSEEDDSLKESSRGAEEDKKEEIVETEKPKPLYERMESGGADLEEIDLMDRDSGERIKPASEERESLLKEKITGMELERKEEELQGRAASRGLGYINLRGLPIMPEALRLISQEEAKKLGIICFIFRRDKEIRLAALEDNQGAQEILKRLSGEFSNLSIKVYLTSRASMAAALKMYDSLPVVKKRVDEVEVLESDLLKSSDKVTDLGDLQTEIEKVSTTELLGLILAAAIKTESSDIHIEAGQEEIQLRFRVDGVLHDVAKLDRDDWAKLISRVKLSSKLKINVRDKPQDGHFAVGIKGDPIDFRVSTLPTAHGESVVMRILYHEKIKQMTLDNLGIEDYNKEILESEIKRPNGMIVVTGPTGAGKTTTLYAILNKLNQPENKIITIEDPIEYKIEGINQSEIKADKGYTFASALRSVVRQDPDIILVGEIRDTETTEIALNAALTGHLVFATLHTNNAAGMIPRFLSLGAKPYLLAPAVNVSLAQRLVRRICKECREEVEINQSVKEQVRKIMESLPDRHKAKIGFEINSFKAYRGKGCKVCTGLGYRGQIGIFEVLKITDEIRDLVLGDGVSEHQLNEIAQKNGMINMIQDGILKAMRGVTSLDEVFRVSQ